MLNQQTTTDAPREVVLTNLHDTQSECVSEQKRFNVVNCGRRWGKTRLGIDLVVERLLTGQPVGWFSPTYKMLEDVWRELVYILQPITESKSEQQHRIQVIGGGVLDCWSLDAADAARGRKYSLVIVDEAAMIADLENIWNMILRPMLVDLKGAAWFLSTPKGRNGFYKLHLLGRDPESEEWKSWTYPTWRNPFIPFAEVEKLRDTMSEESYRQEILAEFLEGEGTVFRNLSAVTTAPIDDKPEAHDNHVIVCGVDWGKQNDFTAISVGCATCRREIFKDRFNQIDYLFQAQRIKEIFHRWTIRSGLIELNSIGQVMMEQLQREGLPVVGFETTAVSKPPLIEGAALEIEKGTLALMPDPLWTSELEAYERKITQTGRSVYGAPAEFHDDTVIARALMIRAMQNYAYVARQGTHRRSPLAEVF